MYDNESMVKRTIIFISHATPEDNEFSLWISTRLKIIGYEVWSDVTKLFGGEKWWDDIEEEILNFTCKFVLVISKGSLSKPGVKREVELALQAERNNNLPNFIVPVIIDDSPFSPQPYDLSDRNIIQFTNQWAKGLSRLMKRFADDGVPNLGGTIPQLAPHISVPGERNSELLNQEEPAISNWLAVVQNPETLNFYRVPFKQNKISSQFSEYRYSWFKYGGDLATFSSKDDLNEYLPQWASATDLCEMTLESILQDNHKELPGFARDEAMKKVNYLLLDAWNRQMQLFGLHCYQLSSGKRAWFFPFIEPYAGMIKYANVYGELKKRQMMGWSKANNVYWHFAVEMKAMFGPEPKMCAIIHVVFSEDGNNPISDKKKMHRLRRKFCRNWWNPRWRDMLYVYLAQLSGEEDYIALSVGKDKEVRMSARPVTYVSPVSLRADDHSSVVEEEVEDVVINLDDVEEFTDDGQ